MSLSLVEIQQIKEDETAFGQEFIDIGASTDTLSLEAIARFVDGLIENLKALQSGNIITNQECSQEVGCASV